ncbi:MAG: hypothetical protein GX361_04585 [Bacteroidales bacterium]|nr:hypothetical protein [Bacteroidales bacterium]
MINYDKDTELNKTHNEYLRKDSKLIFRQYPPPTKKALIETSISAFCWVKEIKTYG